MIKRYFLSFLLLSTLLPFSASAEEILDKKATSKEKIALVLNVGQYTETISESTLAGWTQHSNVFTLSPSERSEFENISYCPVNNIFCALTLTEMQRHHIRLLPEKNVNADKIKLHVDDIARSVNRDPIDAKFQIEDGKVTTFSEPQNGIALDTEKSVEMIMSAIQTDQEKYPQTLDLPFNVKEPEIGYENVNSLGINSLIGEGVSNFKGSTKSRIHNVTVGASRFNGVLIKPGEEFSFVKNLGEVDAEHGYLPELVIKHDKTEPEFGGGICQVSTTTFRAAIYSGLKITARRNHAYPVSYYNPQGMDSTVYIPNPDLRFINNTTGHILIQTSIEGTILKFQFYGTDDGRKITIDGPRVLEKNSDGSMKTTFTQHVFDKNGDEIIKDVFNSSYNSPDKYPHPGEEIFTTKPDNWSKKQWEEYKKSR